jgi:hypothetical protein
MGASAAETIEVSMKVKRSVAAFENDLEGMQGGIALYRRGANEFYLSQSFPWIYERLEAVRRDLEALGMYERCRDALTQAEALITQGPEHDQEAEMSILSASRALMQASGSYEAMQRRYSASNDVSKSQDEGDTQD